MIRTSEVLLAMQEGIARAGLDVERMLDVVVDQASRAFIQAGGAVVALVNGEMLTYAAATGPARDFIGMSLPLKGSLSGSVMLSDTHAMCADTKKDPRVNGDACRRIGVGSMIVVPLRVGDHVRGVLKIYSSEPYAFDERDILSARLLASPIAYGLSAIDTQDATCRFQATFEQAAVGIAHVSPEGNFLRVNARFCTITGRSTEDLLAGGFQEITHADDLAEDLGGVTDLLTGRAESFSMEKRYVRPGGEIVWVNLTVSLVRTRHGNPDFFVAVIEDISARKEAEALAAFDPLTGLPNRRRIEMIVDDALAQAGRGEAAPVIAFLDLDNFKSVNDVRGHAEGDRCLTTVAQTMQRQLRRGDIIGRLGGDEFLVVMKNGSREEAATLLSRLERQVRTLSAAEGWEIGVSAGAIAVAPGTRIGRDRLLKAADKLMYSAKLAAREIDQSSGAAGVGSVLKRAFPIEQADVYADLLKAIDARTQDPQDSRAA